MTHSERRLVRVLLLFKWNLEPILETRYFFFSFLLSFESWRGGYSSVSLLLFVAAYLVGCCAGILGAHHSGPVCSRLPQMSWISHIDLHSLCFHHSLVCFFQIKAMLGKIETKYSCRCFHWMVKRTPAQFFPNQNPRGFTLRRRYVTSRFSSVPPKNDTARHALIRKKMFSFHFCDIPLNQKCLNKDYWLQNK